MDSARKNKRGGLKLNFEEIKTVLKKLSLDEVLDVLVAAIALLYLTEDRTHISSEEELNNFLDFLKSKVKQLKTRDVI